MGRCNQCILLFPFLPWIYLLPLPYPQHQACFQKFLVFWTRTQIPFSQLAWAGAGACMASSRWEPRNPGSNNEIKELQNVYIPVCTRSYWYVRVYTTIFITWLVCTSTYQYVLVQPSYYQSTSPWLGTMEYILRIYSSTKSCYRTSRREPSCTMLYCCISDVHDS